MITLKVSVAAIRTIDKGISATLTDARSKGFKIANFKQSYLKGLVYALSYFCILPHSCFYYSLSRH